jgi:hypothetical protein
MKTKTRTTAKHAWGARDAKNKRRKGRRKRMVGNKEVDTGGPHLSAGGQKVELLLVQRKSTPASFTWRD